MELLRCNREWFRQAKDTPFGHGLLYDLVGYDVLTKEANLIISGTCIPYLGLPMIREVQVFLEECCRPALIKQISFFKTIEDFKKTVKEWRKRHLRRPQDGISAITNCSSWWPHFSPLCGNAQSLHHAGICSYTMDTVCDASYRERWGKTISDSSSSNPSFWSRLKSVSEIDLWETYGPQRWVIKCN